MCPRQDAAELGAPEPLPAPHRLGAAQRKCEGSAGTGDACKTCVRPKGAAARSPGVSGAASLGLESPLSSVKVDAADWGREVSAAAPAPDTPPALAEALPAERVSASATKPRRSPLSARRRSATVPPPAEEEGLASPRGRQSMAAPAVRAARAADALPRRHSVEGTAESALPDRALARYVLAQLHAPPPHEELHAPPPHEEPAARETQCPVPRVNLKRAPASPRAAAAGEGDSMRIPLKDFGRPATPSDRRRRRMLKGVPTSKAGAGPLARSACTMDSASANASGAALTTPL